MRNYEVVVIIQPELDEAAFKEVVEKIQAWITDDNGTISKTDIWGKRDLAYPIKKRSEGQYILLETEMNPEFCVKLERNLGLTESVLRYLVTSRE